ncbi:MAG: T9SS C-terminal target domain-containing protein [Candidatus Zixiibacteriota bacterium]|nr:MAG: T9SS C-terminal target domain-containing protein [candidate division Zixibacteria bacterium]
MRGKTAPAWLLIGLLAGMTGETAAQDIIWNDLVQGYLEGRQLPFFHGGMEYSKPAFADLDGDGDGDLCLGGLEGKIQLFLNLGGNPPEWQRLASSLDNLDVGEHSAPAFWDCEADGDPDLFLGSEAGSIWFYANVGTAQAAAWSFQTANFCGITVDSSAAPLFHDLDADGDDDLLLGHAEGGGAHFRNFGGPVYPQWSFLTLFYDSLDLGEAFTACAADVNADSLDDLVVSSQEGELYYYRNIGPPQNPDYTNAGMVGAVGQNGAPALWDVDGDSDLDLISGQAAGNLVLYENQGTSACPSWGFAQNYFAFFDLGVHSMPVLADLDGDQDLDLVVGRADSGMCYLENVGAPDSAAWHLAVASFAGLNPPGREAPAFCDLDADGDLDLVVGCSDGTLKYLKNLGTPVLPVWDNPVSNYAGLWAGTDAAPVFGDVDDDGDPDLFVGCGFGTVFHLRNDGTPTSPAWTNLGCYPGMDVGDHSAPALDDLDLDGDLDFLIGSGDSLTTLSYYQNGGTPQWPSWDLTSSAFEGWDLGLYAGPCFGDLDGDGDRDLVLGGQGGGLRCKLRSGFVLNVDLVLLPLNPPIVVPPQGGAVGYRLMVSNNEPNPVNLAVWTRLTLPSGVTIGPLDSLTITMNPYNVFNQLLSWPVPDSFPAGTYTLSGYAGSGSQLVYDQDNFTFVKGDSLAVPPGGEDPLDLAFRLEDPHPNPFNEAVRVQYTLPAPGPAGLELYDLSGRRVAVLAEGWQAAGFHALEFHPQGLASGIYFLRLRAGRHLATAKLCYAR